MARRLMKGCEAIGEAAVAAGCRLFFGYPITPQNEIPEYLSTRLPEVGGTFVQAESELAASNMIYGAAAAGERVLTSSSSPGISLMAEAISYLVGAELPAVIVNVMRAGPGLGGILPSQADYAQATRAPGHGGCHVPVLAPASVQEAVDLVRDAFDVADHYRTPVLVLADGMLGQMMEPVELGEGRPPARPLLPKTWATTGYDGRRPRNVITSLYLEAEALERHDLELEEKYARIAAAEVRHEERGLDEPVDVLLVAHGTVARVCASAMPALAATGVRAGLFRPISLWPFPAEALGRAAERARLVLCVELAAGQLQADVREAVAARAPVHLLARHGGVLVTPEEVAEEASRRIAAAAGVPDASARPARAPTRKEAPRA